MKRFEELVFAQDCRYAPDHEWISVAAPHRVGVSDFAQDQLGDLTYVELPEVGRELQAGEEFGSLESIKSVSAVYLPVAGKVTAVNEALQNDPGLVNSDPFGEGWLVEIAPADASQIAALMDVDAYKQQIKESN